VAQTLESQNRPVATGVVKLYPPSELLVDLEADNVLLRAALTEAEDASARHDLVALELKHRLGNLLAVVNAMVRQTFAESSPQKLDDFSARIRALAAAQKLLVDSETRGAMMAEVVKDALAPHHPVGDRMAFSGPDFPLDGRRGHALTLALHELATNAAKYGALSAGDGHVEVVWTIASDRFEFCWREIGGPRVLAPTRRGFGTFLIARNLGVVFAGEVALSFNESGVECRLSAALQA